MVRAAVHLFSLMVPPVFLVVFLDSDARTISEMASGIPTARVPKTGPADER